MTKNTESDFMMSRKHHLDINHLAKPPYNQVYLLSKSERTSQGRSRLAKIKPEGESKIPTEGIQVKKQGASVWWNHCLFSEDCIHLKEN